MKTKKVKQAKRAKRWKPKQDGKYWYVHSFGHVDCDFATDELEIDWLYAFRNVFRTKKLAQAALKRVKAALMKEKK